jgi:hypothetical protein
MSKLEGMAIRRVVVERNRTTLRKRRCVMKKFIAALALISLIAIPTLTQTANAAPVSPSSSSFGSNGY